MDPKTQRNLTIYKIIFLFNLAGHDHLHEGPVSGYLG